MEKRQLILQTIINIGRPPLQAERLVDFIEPIVTGEYEKMEPNDDRLLDLVQDYMRANREKVIELMR